MSFHECSAHVIDHPSSCMFMHVQRMCMFMRVQHTCWFMRVHVGLCMFSACASSSMLMHVQRVFSACSALVLAHPCPCMSSAFACSCVFMYAYACSAHVLVSPILMHAHACSAHVQRMCYFTHVICLIPY